MDIVGVATSLQFRPSENWSERRRDNNLNKRSPRVRVLTRVSCRVAPSVTLTLNDGSGSIGVTKIADERLGQEEMRKFGGITNSGIGDKYLRVSAGRARAMTA